MATTFAVPDGRVAMAATLYTGTGATLAVSNAVNAVSFQPDLVWVKSRSQTADHGLQDSVRGTPILYPNLTSAESAGGYWITSYNSNGFTMNTNTSGNNSGSTYVGWQWNAGGTTVTNGVGTISSQVRANTTAGFSVVTWTGTGTGAASVGHGLSALPQLVFVKKRNAVANWYVASYGPQGLNYAYHLFLNTTDALSGSNDPYILGAQSSLTSNVLQVAAGNPNNGGNESGTTYVAYCWAPVAGYSAFGSYMGNGSADGPFIYTGFRPRYVMVKGSSLASNWNIFDSSRATYNANDTVLFADLSNAESSPATSPIDFLSNGIKIRNATNATNSSGNTYIYAAFAENPLKYANAR
jgi:hypothetical protein